MPRTWLLSVLSLVGLLVCVWSNQDQSPVVFTRKGVVRGFIQESTKGKPIYSFLSIPFATPPLGNLRFKAPKVVFEWLKPLNATVYPPLCIQFDILSSGEIIGQEDCLYLNIYSSKLPDEENPKLPVMVWIHGGGFSAGSGTPQIYSPKVLLNKDMVLVTINYRLGPFGFFSTGDDVIQGNMGLKDQNMALRWIKDNIEFFGGDRDSITLAGESAGSASVNYHMLSPMSRGLFHKAIQQSGSALSYWAYLEPHEIASRTRKAAKLLNCPTDTSEAMLQCLQKMDAQEVAAVHPKLIEWLLFPTVPFSPTKEVAGTNRFMDKSPQEALAEMANAPVQIPLMTGICENEGEFIVSALLRNKLLQELNDNYLKLFPLLLGYDYVVKEPDEYSRKIKEFYFGDKEISEETLPELIKMMSDNLINFGSYQAIPGQQAAHVKPIYYYLFSFLGKFSFSQDSGRICGGPSYKPVGASHVDDLLYLFQFPPITTFEEGSPEERISDMMTTWWFNFISTGNPTPHDAQVSAVNWDPVEKHSFKYLNMSQTPQMQTDFFDDRITFWKELYDTMQPAKSKAKDEL